MEIKDKKILRENDNKKQWFVLALIDGILKSFIGWLDKEQTPNDLTGNEKEWEVE